MTEKLIDTAKIMACPGKVDPKGESENICTIHFNQKANTFGINKILNFQNDMFVAGDGLKLVDLQEDKGMVATFSFANKDQANIFDERVGSKAFDKCASQYRIDMVSFENANGIYIYQWRSYKPS